MLSPKLIIIPAAVGFLLSFIISLFSKASFLIALLRGGIFLLVFGGLSVLIQFLVSRFIPELLDVDKTDAPSQDELQPGNLVDVTVGDSTPYGQGIPGTVKLMMLFRTAMFPLQRFRLQQKVVR